MNGYGCLTCARTRRSRGDRTAPPPVGARRAVQGASVTFNGVAGPLFAVVASANQINVLVPRELPESGTIPVQVKTPAGAGASFTLTMSSAAPGTSNASRPRHISQAQLVFTFYQQVLAWMW